MLLRSSSLLLSWLSSSFYGKCNWPWVASGVCSPLPKSQAFPSASVSVVVHTLEFAPGGGQETACGARDWTQVSFMQGSSHTSICTSLGSPLILVCSQDGKALLLWGPSVESVWRSQSNSLPTTDSLTLSFHFSQLHLPRTIDKATRPLQVSRITLLPSFTLVPISLSGLNLPLSLYQEAVRKVTGNLTESRCFSELIWHWPDK